MLLLDIIFRKGLQHFFNRGFRIVINMGFRRRQVFRVSLQDGYLIGAIIFYFHFKKHAFLIYGDPLFINDGRFRCSLRAQNLARGHEVVNR